MVLTYINNKASLLIYKYLKQVKKYISVIISLLELILLCSYFNFNFN